MKYMKALLIVAMMVVTVPVMAQTGKDADKNNSRARIETVNDQTVLVLKAGYNKTIDLKIEADTWRQLDSIVAGPWGSVIKLEDI